MLEDDLKYRIESLLGGSIDGLELVTGGCISQSARLVVEQKSYFLKWGEGNVAATFSAEARGLAQLARVAALITIPTVLEHIDFDDNRGALILEWLESGSSTAVTWKHLGEGLARIHRSCSDRFGFEEDNFIGSTIQTNARSTSWITFFRNCRLLPQVQLARSRGLWKTGWEAGLERLLVRLSELLPDQPEMSLVHGDLWTGNVVVQRGGVPALIDPAVYYGHREVDLAMSTLFGSFNVGFYEAYSYSWPLEPGYRERAQIYNLYHQINHLNLFGNAYSGAIDSILRRF